MSVERIDHAAEARRSDEMTPEQWVTFSFETNDASNLYTAIQEQKHATLALVEQQRIANLIALAGLPTREGPVSDYADELRNEALATLAHYESRPPDDEAIEIDPDIAAALGL